MYSGPPRAGATGHWSAGVVSSGTGVGVGHFLRPLWPLPPLSWPSTVSGVWQRIGVEVGVGSGFGACVAVGSGFGVSVAVCSGAAVSVGVGFGWGV
jgi:hypothetical protein